MAKRESRLSKEEKASGKFDEGNQGLSTKEKGTVVPVEDRVPSNPAYKDMTKAQFVAEMARLKEKKIAMKKLSKEWDAKKQAELDALDKPKPAPEAPAPEVPPTTIKKPKKKSKKK